jgi:hypothetical protein
LEETDKLETMTADERAKVVNQKSRVAYEATAEGNLRNV